MVMAPLASGRVSGGVCVMSRSLRNAAVAVAAGMTFGTSSVLADGYYAGSIKDAAPVPAPEIYQWDGLSVGVGVGVGRFDQDGSAKAWRKDEVDKLKKKCFWLGCKWKHKGGFDSAKGMHEHASEDDWNIFGTVQIGYDKLLGDRFLIGAFADFDLIKDSSLNFSEKTPWKSLTGEIEREYMWTIGGRVGFLVTPRILVYGLAGFSRMNLDGNVNVFFKDPFRYGSHSNHTNLGLSVDETVDGWTAGGGLEAKLDKRLSLKIEYRYSNFDGISAKVREGDHDSWKKNGYLYTRDITEGAKLNLDDTEIHSIRAVLSFKLGADTESWAPLK